MLQNCYERAVCSHAQLAAMNTMEIHTIKDMRKCIILQAGNALKGAETLVYKMPKYYYVMKKLQYCIELRPRV